jgi:hypothetical protein
MENSFRNCKIIIFFVNAQTILPVFGLLVLKGRK